MVTGIVFSILTYWLFSQTLYNVVPMVQEDMGISLGVLNTVISLTSLIAGLSIVVMGGLADQIGKKANGVFWSNFKYYWLSRSYFCTKFNIANCGTCCSRFIRSMSIASNACLN